MPQTVSVSAPAKLFLLGEHAVVFDGACIITAVSARLFATLTHTNDGLLTLHAPDVGLANYRKPLVDVVSHPEKEGNSRFIESCIAVFHEKDPISGGLHITTRNEFNKDLGIGSSSAVVAATLFGLAQIYEIELSPAQLLDMGIAAIQRVQNLGSGADLAAAVYGGTIYYVNRAPRMVTPIILDNLPIFAVWSGKKVATVNLVQEVGKLYERRPTIGPAIIATMLNIVESGKIAFEEEDWTTVGELMNIQHGLLHSLGVDTSSLANIIFAAREAGSLGAKLSGAGGGDCAVVLASPANYAQLQDNLQQAGHHVVDYTLNAKGVRLEPVAQA